MPDSPYLQLDNGDTIPITVRGYQLLNRPMLNRGTAFTRAERAALGLNGLLPPGEVTLEVQVRRVYAQFQTLPNPISKNVFLTQLRDRNEVLYYRLLAEHMEEMLPIVYTPTVGQAIQEYSQWYSKPRGVYVSISDMDHMEEALLNYGLSADEVDLIVVTDSEGILGIGDQGIGGIAITTGKLAVYTAAAGFHPRRCIPVVLDPGTDNLRLLNDEDYLGERHSRVRGERYDAFIDKFVRVCTKLFPHALIHWEDFGAQNAHRILEHYRDEICTFNDDIQGTAAVVLAAALAAVNRIGQQMSEQRIVIYGAGTAGVGIADAMRDVMIEEGLSREEANRRFWCLGSRGLITQGMSVRSFQEPYARAEEEVVEWERGSRGITLDEVVRRVHPTMLIGTSAQAHAFSKQIVQEMHSHTARPIIMALSNPTSLAEQTPHNLMNWTNGKALVATGSPFPPVTVGDMTFHIAQANNALIFPGLGLGVAVSRATRVSDKMVIAAARAVSALSADVGRGGSLLPGIDSLRTVSAAVALAVAKTAAEEGLATVEMTDPVQQVLDQMWRPEYAKVVLPEHRELTPEPADAGTAEDASPDTADEE